MLADVYRQKQCEIAAPASGSTGVPLNIREKRREMDPALLPK